MAMLSFAIGTTASERRVGSVLFLEYTFCMKHVKRNERGKYQMTHSANHAETHSEPRLRGFALISVMSALLLTLLLEALDQTIVGTALPRIIEELHGLDRYSWVVTVAVQNAVPAERLGISTAGLRYLGQLGASLGIAIVGTVVSGSISGNLLQHLPTDQAGKLLLSDALQHGFVAVLVFAGIALLVTFFLQDVPFVS